MRKQNGILLLAAVFFALIVAGIGACKKVETVIPPVRAVFLTPSTSATFSILFPGAIYKIPLGITTVSKEDRTINISVFSPTGAVAGTHYTLDKTSVVIPAGKVVDTIVLTGAYNQYIAGRKDTVVFSVMSSSEPASFNSSFRLALTGPCFEGDIATDLNSMLGTYANTYDGSYGPYSTVVKSATLTSSTTANIVVGNVYDWGWDDLTFTLNWSNPSSLQVTYVTQNTGFDAGNLNSIVAGHNVWITPPTSGSMGTFSYCNKTITINYRMCMPTYGACFTTPVTTSMAK